jgi:hypothetical protein
VAEAQKLPSRGNAAAAAAVKTRPLPPPAAWATTELTSVTPKKSSARKSLVVRWNHSRGKSARGEVTVWYRLGWGTVMFPHCGW